MTRRLNHFGKPLLPNFFVWLWPVLGICAWFYLNSLFLLLIGTGLGMLHYRKMRRHRRAQYIEQYCLPSHLAALPSIERGFKDFCLIHLDQPKPLHHMPSKAVDALWHTFILDTRSYAVFCDRAFGHMLHHRPALDMQSLSSSAQQQALKATWRGACQLENIRPHAAHSLPFLFGLDLAIGWPDGQHYALDQLNNLLRYGDCSSMQDGGGLSCSVDLSDCGGSGNSDSSDSGDGGGGCGD